VFGVSLSSCENVKQSCGGRPMNVVIPAGQRRDVWRVQPKDREKSFGYRWSFSYRADSSDAKAIAALREHGIDVDGRRLVPRDASAPDADASVAQAGTAPSSPSELSTAPDTTAASERRVVYRTPGMDDRIRDEAELRASSPVSFRIKLGYGAILGWQMMPPGSTVKPTGACVDPVESAKYERDPKITRTPWRPPVVGRVTSLRVGDDVKDSTAKIGDLLVRFVVDTTGKIIPETVSVLESPSVQISARACTAVMSTPSKPARDKEGRNIRAWVQMPVVVSRD
jgi:hypothetical protein